MIVRLSLGQEWIVSTVGVAYQQDVQALYSDHHGWLYGWLRRTLGCPQHAADVAQNTFLRILTTRAAPSQIEQPRAWLTTTARRLIVDEVRRDRLEQAHRASLTTEGWQDVACPERSLVATQTLEHLNAVLRTSAPNARRAFVRHYLDGATLAVVAGELGVSTRMVQKYLAQVLVQCHDLGL